MRVGPIVIGAFVLALAIDARQVLASRRLYARGLRQLGEKLLIALAAVAAHDTAQRRIGFKRGCVNANRLPVYQPRFGELLEVPGEKRQVRLEVDQPTRTRDRGVVGRRLHQLHIQKSAQRKGVGRSPGDSALRIEPFKVANQQQSKIATGHQTWSPHRLRIKPRAQPLNVRIKPGFIQNPIQALIKRMRRRSRQIAAGNPYRRLTPTALTFSHGHACDCTTPLNSSRMITLLFTTNRADFHHRLHPSQATIRDFHTKNFMASRLVRIKIDLINNNFKTANESPWKLNG